MRAILLGLLLPAVVGSPVTAAAAVPANDDFADASVVSSLPYNDVSSTIDATSAPEDAGGCGGGNSIWYSYTPTGDGSIEANTLGSDFDTVLTVYTDSGEGLAVVACNDDKYDLASAVRLPVQEGTTYYFLIQGFSDAAGRTEFNLLEAAPLLSNLTVSVTRGTVTRDGTVTIGGSVVCDQEGSAYIDVSGRQGSGRLTAAGSGQTQVPCSQTSQSWSLTFSSQNGVRFVPGRISVSYEAYAFDNWGGSDSDTGATVLQVKRA